MLIAPGRCDSLYSSEGSTSTSCAPPSSSSRTSSLKIVFGTGGYLRREGFLEHLDRRRPLEAFGGGVHPATERVLRPFRDGEQVSPVHPYRRATGEPELLSLLVGVDRDQFYPSLDI